jgi:hypothetical protein
MGFMRHNLRVASCRPDSDAEGIEWVRVPIEYAHARLPVRFPGTAAEGLSALLVRRTDKRGRNFIRRAASV